MSRTIARQVTGTVNLDLRRLGFAARGKLILSDAWYGKTRVGAAELLWEADPKAARLRSASNDFFGGSYVVDATLQSLDRTRTTVVASGRNIELEQLSGVAGNQLAMDGLLDGDLRLESIGDLASLSVNGSLITRGASIAGAPIQLQTTKLRVADGLGTIAIRGSGFDGSLTADASSKLTDLLTWVRHEPRQLDQLAVFGRLQAKDIAVRRVLSNQTISILPYSFPATRRYSRRERLIWGVDDLGRSQTERSVATREKLPALRGLFRTISKREPAGSIPSDSLLLPSPRLTLLRRGLSDLRSEFRAAERRLGR